MTDPLAGVRAIVTGGASGMGAGIVAAYAAHGAQVISLDLQAGPGAEIAEKATAAGPGSAAFRTADVSDKASVDAAFAEAAEGLGGPDVLGPAAGVAPGGAGRGNRRGGLGQRARRQRTGHVPDQPGRVPLLQTQRRPHHQLRLGRR